MTTDIENIPKGIVWMLCTMFLFVSMDTVAKHLMQTFPVLQVVWARFFFHLLTMTLVLACIKRTAMLATLKSGNLKLQIFRSSLLVLTTGLFFTGLSQASLATASTMMFLSPIYVTVLSIPVLGERVGPRRWLGVLAGFIGALIIIRPGGESFTTGHLLLMIAPLSDHITAYRFGRGSTDFFRVIIKACRCVQRLAGSRRQHLVVALSDGFTRLYQSPVPDQGIS